jgi:predicted  nucleic acid-binding Zn-ribbon protein
MTKHKKMYKAGKRWVVATLTVASVAVAGATVNSRVAHADTVSGTETQQVSNTVNTNNEDNDPRITVVSGDQNQAQRDNLQQQAQDLQQQVEDSNANLNNTQEQLKQYQQQQAANDQSIKDDQDQIDRGQQLVDQAKQNKTNRITELRRQKDANNTATMKLAAESTSNTNKIKDLQSKYTSLQKQYATVSHKYFSGDYSLKPEVDQLDNDMNTMWQTIHTLQLDGIDLIDKMNKYTDSNLTLGKEIDALVDDANPYLSEDKDRYEQGQKLVEQYTKQLAIDQAKSSLADQIRSLQNSIRNFSDQLNQTKEKLDQLNVQIAALPAVFQVKKVITRNIIINLPGGSQKSLNQVATITGMKTVTNGQTAYSNWTTATWQAFTAPWDFGAEYIAPSLPAQTVDNSTADQTITLSYTVAGDFTKENYGKLNTVLITPSMGGDLVRLSLEGWHVAGAALNHAYIIVKDQQTGQVVATTSYQPLDSQEAQHSYPQITNSAHAGFSVVLNIPLKTLNDPLEVIARYTNGDSYDTGHLNADYSFAPIKADMGNHAWLDQCAFVNGKLHVAGWHATNQAPGATHTIILFDATRHCEIGRTTVGNDLRNDVQAIYPTIYNAGYSGFSADFDVTPGIVGDQLQIISRWSGNDTNTNYVDYWFPAKVMMSGEDNNAYLDQAKVSNNHFTVVGWHATNQALGKNYHYIIVIDPATGKEIARQLVNAGTDRPDVSRAFPGIADADQSGFKVAFTPNAAFAQARQLTIISRWTADRDGNNNYVDYWFAPVTRPTIQDNAGALESERYAWDTLGVTGWHATDQSLTEPYRTLILIDNTLHKEVARQSISSVARPDIAKKYPNIAGVGNSGFDTHFKVNGADPTHDFTLISRYSATRDANENCTDYDFHLGQLW